MDKIALDLKKGDILNEEYMVVWISKVQPRDGTCFFDIKKKDGSVRKVECPPSTTFKVKEL